MAKKIILALFILVLILIIIAANLTDTESVNIFIDGENVTVKSNAHSNINTNDLNEDLCDFTFTEMNDTDSNITTLRNGISNICLNYGMDNPTINIDSSIGENQIPVMVYVDGTSMLPTLKDGQNVIINKTKNVHVGDIVVANSPEYGGIIKRVDEIDGNMIHLISDNKNITYEYVDGVLYEVKGITTWVDISDINGVVIKY